MGFVVINVVNIPAKFEVGSFTRDGHGSGRPAGCRQRKPPTSQHKYL